MTPSVYVNCPNCGEEVEVGMIYEPPEYDINIQGGWCADGYVLGCDCDGDDERDKVVFLMAEEIANADPEFGRHPDD